MNDAHILLRATCAIYAGAARDAWRALVRNPWLALLVPAYTALLHLAAILAAPLGFAGGFLLGFALAACASSFLAVLAEATSHERVDFGALGSSFGRYLWSVVSIFFIFWIIQFLLSAIIETNAGLAWLAVLVNAALFVVCNPVPELIYQSPRDGMQLVDEAITFTRENAIEWLAPVAILLLPLFALDVRTGLLIMSSIGPTNALGYAMMGLSSLLPSMGPVGLLVIAMLASAGIAWVMLFRGFLFRVLSRSGRRQRIFDARMRGL